MDRNRREEHNLPGREVLPGTGVGRSAYLLFSAWALLLCCCVGLLSPLAWAEDADEASAPDGTAYAWRSAGAKGMRTRGLSSLRIHPKNASVLWAHVHGMGPARSEDGGRTWTRMVKGIPEKSLPSLRSRVRISLDQQKARTLYLVIDGQIFRSEDGGDTWESKSSGALTSLSWTKLKSTHLSWQVEVDPQKPVRLLVGSRNDGAHNGGLFESKNSAKAWEQIAGTDIPKSGLGNDTYLIRMDPKSEKYLTVAGLRALWRSDDRGRNFSRNDPGGEGIHENRGLSYIMPGMKELFLADARGVWRSKDGGKKWEKKPARSGDALDVVVDPFNRKRLYAIFHDTGLWVSEDPRKVKWEQLGGVYGEAVDGDESPPTGYRDAVIREVVVHPRERKTIYLTSPVTGLHVSVDAGKTFTPVATPDGAKPETIIPAVVPPMALVGVHPASKGQHLGISVHGVVFASEDRGETWSVRGRLGMAPGLLVADAAPHTWWAMGRYLLRSTDDGATWARVGPFGVDPKADPEEHIIAFYRGAGADGKPGLLRVLLERSGVLLTSDDDGVKWVASKAPWKPVKGGGDQTWAVAMAVNPAQPGHTVIAARTTRESPSRSDENGGIFETWDGGKTWEDITGGLKPGKKDASKARRKKANWNRAALLGIDAGSGLLVYGANGRGLFTREVVDPKGKKPENAPTWVDVSPKAPQRATILAGLFTRTEDGKDTRIVLQLEGENGETVFQAIAGATLKSLRDLRAGVKDAEDDAEDDAEESAAWTVLPSPGETVRLGSLVADAQLPGRLLGTDRHGEQGIMIFEIPGSKPGGATPNKSPGAGPGKNAPDKNAPDKNGAGKKGPGTEGGEKKDAGSPADVTPPAGMRAFTTGQDKAVRFWLLDKAASATQLTGHEGAVGCVALSPDQKYLLTAGADKTLRIWDAATGEVVATIPVGAQVNALAIDVDGQHAYLALEAKGQILQINLATKALRTFAGHTAGVTALGLSEDTNRAYSGSKDKTIRVWDTQQGTPVNEIAFGAVVTALAVAPDGSLLFALGADGVLRVFDATGKGVGQKDMSAGGAPTALALSADGLTLFVGGQGGVQALHTKVGVPESLVYAAPERSILAVTSSVDGKWILGGDDQGALWLWAAGETQARWTVKAHDGPILDIAVTSHATPAASEPSKPSKPGDSPKAADGDKPADK